jgi:pilus assembly protein CpaF
VDALRRLATLALLAGLSLPFSAVVEQVGAAVDAVVQVARGSDGHRRVVNVAEVLPAGEGLGTRPLMTSGREGLVAVGTATRPARRVVPSGGEPS